METTIFIDDKERLDASVMANSFADKEIGTRAYINTLGVKLAIKYIQSEGIEIPNDNNLHSIRKVIEEFDISDIILPNLHIDVRVIYDENLIFIPKSHFEYDITPDIYIVIKIDKEYSNAEFLGFFEPKLINKNNKNDKYYFIEKEKLSPISDLIQYINSHNSRTDEKLNEDEFEKFEEKIIAITDNDISEDDKHKLITQLIKSYDLREQFIEFENFETLSHKAMNDDAIEKPELPHDTEVKDEFDEFDNLNVLEDLAPTEEEAVVAEEENSTPIDEIETISLPETDETSDNEESNEILETLSDAGAVVGANILAEAAAEALPNTEAIDTVNDLLDTEAKENTESTPELISFDNILTDETSNEETDNNITETTETIEPTEENTINFDSLELPGDNNPEDLPINDEQISLEPISEPVDSLTDTVEPIDEPITENIDSEIQDLTIEPIEESINENIDSEIQDLTMEPIDEPINENTEPEIQDLAIEPIDEPINENTEPEIQDLAIEPIDSPLEEIPSLDQMENTELLEDINLQEEVTENIETPEQVDILDESSNDTVLPENTETDEEQSNTNISFEDNYNNEEMSAAFGNLNAGNTSDEESVASLSFDTVQEPEYEPMEEIEKDTISFDDIVLNETEDQTNEYVEETVSFDNLETGSNDESNTELTSENTDNQTENNDTIFDDIVNLDEISGDNSEIQENNTENNESFGKNLLENLNAENLDNIIIEEAEEQKPEFETNVEPETYSSTSNEAIDILETINSADTSVPPKTDEELIADIFDDGTQQEQNNIDVLYNENNQIPETNIEDIQNLEDFVNEQNEQIDSTASEETYSEEESVQEDQIDDAEQPEQVQEEEPEQTATTPVNNQPQKSNGKKNLLVAAALLTLLVGFAAYSFLKQPKSEIVANNDQNTVVEDNPIVNNKPQENVLAQNAPDINATAKTPTQTNKTKQDTQELKSKPAATAAAQKPKQTSSGAYMTVNKLVWDVPEDLSHNAKMQSFLKTTGKSIKLSLSTDLLLADEYAYTNHVKVSLAMDKKGSVKSTQIINSSGSKQIDEIVLQSVKDTLNVVKAPSDAINGRDFNLNLIIYF